MSQFPGVAPTDAPALPLVLLIGFDDGQAAEAGALLAAECRVARARSARQEAAVLCLGPQLSPIEARHRISETGALVLLTGAGPEPAAFQDLIDSDRLFYLSAGELRAPDLAALVRAALAHRRAAEAGEPPSSGELQAVNAARRVAAQPDLASAGGVLQLAAEETVEADRVYCLLYDAAGEVLWSRSGELSGEERRESAAVGLVSFAARTGSALRIERASEEPRFEPEADDPLGGRCEHLLAVPVRAPESAAVLAVLCAVRDAGRAAFTAADEAELELLAATVGPALAQVALAARLGEARERPGIFREEAFDYHVAGAREGDWLRLSPRWTKAASWLLVAVLAVAFAVAALSTIEEHSSGPAVVRLGGRVEGTASQPGTVRAVEVRPGERVAAGDVIVRFENAREAAELARISGELDLQLVERLRDLSAPAPAQALIRLRAERDLALARMEERVVRAAAAGVVRDVRCKPGQQVAAGDILFSVGTAGARPTLTALLPGEHRPLLRPGMPLSMELRGYAHAPQRLTIAAVSDEVIGPEEARRLLGPEVATAVPLNGQLVRVEAFFPDETFEARGERFALHDGMWGAADVPVRSEPILAALVPGLRVILERARG